MPFTRNFDKFGEGNPSISLKIGTEFQGPKPWCEQRIYYLSTFCEQISYSDDCDKNVYEANHANCIRNL